MSDERVNIKLSVRNLVEFIMRSGDIDNRRGSTASKDVMQAGSRIHRKIQRSMQGNYHAEVSVKKSFDKGCYLITVEGRADGIFEEDGETYIDEIKGMFMELHYLEEPFEVHQAQAMCYAWFYAEQSGLEKISVQMTYVNIETEEVKRFRIAFATAFLKEWFGRLLERYIKWADYQYQEREKRQISIQNISFPFPYREGQRELAVSVYRTIQRKKQLFIQAPTGVGKTISAVFPAVKAVGEALGEKIFYLTAKTITRTVAEEAFVLLREQGLFFKTVTITAKDKLCLCEEKDCNPAACPYAKGHYDRVNDAVYDILQHENAVQRENLIAYAQKHMVCPFEMCLDVSNWVDGIICDYNYVFDFNVRLKRYFSEGIKGEYIFLIDEAHNLVERAREMYSAKLYKEDFLELKALMKPVSRRLAADLEECNKCLLEWKRQCSSYMLLENAGGFTIKLMKLIGHMESFMDENHSFEHHKRLTEFYLEVRNFIMIHELLDDSYRIYTEMEEGGRFLIKLLCVHTAANLRQCLDKSNSSILFSATLLPIQYYKELLSKNPDDYAIYADSPFDRKKRLLLAATDVSSKYTRRTETEYKKMYRHIENMIDAKQGNYMVFFPSYQLMEQVYEASIYEGIEKKADILLQKSNMGEMDREEFLQAFEVKNRKKSFVAFCVLGGIFSEGIDLKEERLIGAAIVGTGLPQICTEKEILKQYHEEKEQNGFDFAYRYPGMNKVLQAAGRVIRTQNDYGVILLMDQRFQEKQYQYLFPREWEDCQMVTTDTAASLLHSFWENVEREKTVAFDETKKGE